MAITIDGAGPLAGATTLNGLTIPTTGFGKVLQVVRATDTTSRSTTSTSFVDVTGITVTITPQKDTSAILLIASIYAGADSAGSDARASFQITDNSNNAISGAQNCVFGASDSTLFFENLIVPIGYATPATTSATTFKLRFRSFSATTTAYAFNASQDGQLYAIEVSA